MESQCRFDLDFPDGQIYWTFSLMCLLGIWTWFEKCWGTLNIYWSQYLLFGYLVVSVFLYSADCLFTLWLFLLLWRIFELLQPHWSFLTIISQVIRIIVRNASLIPAPWRNYCFLIKLVSAIWSSTCCARRLFLHMSWISGVMPLSLFFLISSIKTYYISSIMHCNFQRKIAYIHLIDHSGINIFFIYF